MWYTKKRIILIAFFLLIFANYVFADCQYKQNETYQDLVTGFFWVNGTPYGQPLVAGNFTPTDLHCATGPYFKVYNQNSMNFKINVSYRNYHPAANPQFPELLIDENRVIDLKGYSNAIVMGSCISSFGSNMIQPDSVKYEVLEPTIFQYGTNYVTKTREVCKMCGPVQCLNDGAACSSNSTCGSSICNIAGVCGAVNSSSIVSCPNEKLNCNNQSCLVPSIKEIGQAYSCVWECKSSVGEDGVCAKTQPGPIFSIIFPVVIVIFILSVSYFFFKRGMSKKEQIKIAKRIDELNNVIQSKKSEIETIQKKEKNLEKRKENINKLKENIRQSLTDLENEKEKLKIERKKPFLNKQGHKVIIDENGYEKLINFNQEFFHRWWFKQKHNREIKTGYEIHHKDFDKRNNDINNLEELTHEDHKKRHIHRWDKK